MARKDEKAEDQTSLPIVPDSEGEGRIDSRTVAAGLGIQHPNFMQTLETYKADMERFGVIRFETRKPPRSSLGGRPERFVLLNEGQATFAVTLSRNTPQVVEFKARLVLAFQAYRTGALQRPTAAERQEGQRKAHSVSVSSSSSNSSLSSPLSR
jgi:phage regulator Rha-like protein